MPEGKQTVGSAITRRLKAARVGVNWLSVRDLREWANEYLAMRDEDLAKTPQESNCSHWDLLMQDSGSGPGFFAVFVFYPRPRGLEFFCGTGDSWDVRGFSECHFPDDPKDMFEAMRKRFTVPGGRLRVGRKSAERWLGRGWE